MRTAQNIVPLEVARSAVMSGEIERIALPVPESDEGCPLAVSTLQMQTGGDPNSKHEEIPAAQIEESVEKQSQSDRTQDTELNARRREFLKQLASVFIQIYIASKDVRGEQKAA